MTTNKSALFYSEFLEGPLREGEFELTPMLDMKAIAVGSYTIRVEMYELWSDGEKLSFTQRGYCRICSKDQRVQAY